MGSYLSLIILTICSIGLVLSGLVFTRKILNKFYTGQYEHQASACLSIAATSYSIVLGLIVASALSDFQAARVNVQDEATCLRNIYHICYGMPIDFKTKMENAIIAYTNLVVTDEWKAMDKGDYSVSARMEFLKIWSIIAGFKPKDNQESNLHAQLLNLITNVSDARHKRLLAASPSFGPVIHSFLWCGGLITIMFTYFFYLKNFSLQIFMTVLVTLLILFNLLMVEMFGYPFSGDLKIKPDAFVFDLNGYEFEKMHY